MPFVLFSTNALVSDQTKEDIARRIGSMPMPDQFRLRKPGFREITADTSLVDLVGPESYTLFRALKVSTDWLAKPVIEWRADPDFITADTFVHTVKVVNDADE